MSAVCVQDIFRPCLPVDNPDDISGNSNVPAIIGCVLGALILVIISAILVLQFMRMFRRRRLNHLSQGEDPTTMYIPMLVYNTWHLHNI